MNPLDFSLDFRSGIPIYVQIVTQTQQLVSSGILKPGDQLPTVRQLASELRVNFNTVARAYRMLDDAGLISTQQGRGTFILDQPMVGLQDVIKSETLDDQVTNFLSDMVRQGYSLNEVQAITDKKITDWLNEQPGK